MNYNVAIDTPYHTWEHISIKNYVQLCAIKCDYVVVYKVST